MTAQDKGAEGEFTVTWFHPSQDSVVALLYAEITRLRKENEALRANGEFLLARLDELEWCEGRMKETLRNFMGHVEPAVERFRAVLRQTERVV